MPKNKTLRVPPADAVLDKAVDELLHCYGQLFSYFFWRQHLIPMLRPHAASITPQAEAIENACAESVLINFRKIDEFFLNPSKKYQEREGAFRAYDFPRFAHSGPVLSTPARQDLHKRVAHITTEEATKGKMTWYIWSTIDHFMKHGTPFFDYLLQDFYAGKPERKQAIQRNIKVLRELWAAVQDIIKELDKSNPPPTPSTSP